jgi:hypothetical protein
MSASSEREIWYLLVDSNGTPFNGTGLSKVALAVDKDVYDFGVAVKEAYNLPAYLGLCIEGILGQESFRQSHEYSCKWTTAFV